MWRKDFARVVAQPIGYLSPPFFKMNVQGSPVRSHTLNILLLRSFYLRQSIFIFRILALFQNNFPTRFPNGYREGIHHSVEVCKHRENCFKKTLFRFHRLHFIYRVFHPDSTFHYTNNINHVVYKGCIRLFSLDQPRLSYPQINSQSVFPRLG